ncbi:hypothetical protein DMY04_23830 [Enterobacter hormaechei subsp. steigerwaltii]|uniref:helix-turn-helix domain-containing protein n=1 Tax=Enterobacter hormaechei TaxID=158836 RepID=UPI000D75C5C3|nr:helix-turn-helix domain-containing protein [Enterobacter hormaechei]PXY62091.1 hypothetical protein DMY04_23830 [Enterobacter hormaechei subsp. steigerwaltii]
MAKTLAEIKADYQYTDKQTGEVKDRTINTPHYFRDIPRIYSPNLQDGYMDFCPKAQKLYCYFQGWENSGNFCYESQTELGKVIDLSRERTCKLIQKLQDAGLITKEKNPGYRSKVYRTFPITDAHITPPEALTVQPDIISDVVPEPATAEETQDDATEKSEPLGLPETITDEMKIDAMCDLLSKPESLRQQNRGDTFINYARRVLHRKSMKLPSRLEEELEMRFEHRYPHFYGRFGTPF